MSWNPTQGQNEEADRLRNERAQEDVARRDAGLSAIYRQTSDLAQQMASGNHATRKPGVLHVVEGPTVSWWRRLIGGQAVVDGLVMQLTASRALLESTKAASAENTRKLGEKFSEVYKLRGALEENGRELVSTMSRCVRAEDEADRLKAELTAEQSRSESLRRESAKARKKARRMWQSSLASKRQLAAETAEVRRLRGLLVEAIAERNEARMAGRAVEVPVVEMPARPTRAERLATLEADRDALLAQDSVAVTGSGDENGFPPKVWVVEGIGTFTGVQQFRITNGTDEHVLLAKRPGSNDPGFDWLAPGESRWYVDRPGFVATFKPKKVGEPASLGPWAEAKS